MHRTGLEPVTTRFEAGYSIQLSYRCNRRFFTKLDEFTGLFEKRQDSTTIRHTQKHSKIGFLAMPKMLLGIG